MTKPAARFSVFQVINERRNEIYVGSTDKPIFEVLARLESGSHAPIKGWSGQSIRLVSLGFGLTKAEARGFIKQHVSKGLPRGWRFLT